MSYKLGYIADRTGVPSKAKQQEKLIEYGVDEMSIYENLDDCLASLRADDRLCVYTTAILGRNKLNSTFLTVGEKDAVGVFSIKMRHLYRCDESDGGIKVLADAWDELNNITKNQIAEVGRQLGGRKQSKVWAKSDEINESRNQGMSFKELAEVHNTSQATIHRIIDSYEEK